MWHILPSEIMEDLRVIEKFTKRTGREASITLCRRPGRDKIFTANNAEGDNNATEVLECNEEFGSSTKIGDVHTHPVYYDTIGILPSQADITGLVEDSYNQNVKQIGCRTNHAVPYIHCMQPKHLPKLTQVKKYEAAADRDYGGSLARGVRKGGVIDPYYLDNVGKDFEVGIYDRYTGEKIDKPDYRKLMRTAFGTSSRYVRQVLHEMKRGVFCDYVQDLTFPHDDHVGITCRDKLKTREFFGYEYEKHWVPQKIEQLEFKEETSNTCLYTRNAKTTSSTNVANNNNVSSTKSTKYTRSE